MAALTEEESQMRYAVSAGDEGIDDGSEWIEKFSEAKQRKFWKNTVTGEKTWSNPFKPKKTKSGKVSSDQEAEQDVGDQEAESPSREVVVDSRPSILILGGVGSVGRIFVKFLVTRNLASKIRVADKTIPAIAFLHIEEEEAFNQVEFVQADLTKPPHLERVFANHQFDYVVNLAAETRYGQSAAVYAERCTTLSKMCALKAQTCGVRKFIEVSTAQVYKSQSKRPSTESAAVAPWTGVAQAKLAAESEVLAVEGLHSIILRPSCIYGPGDAAALMPRIICAAAYVELEEKMKFLWDASMKLNTVHVNDVCQALWHVLENHSIGPKSIFNLSDKGDTDQGKVNQLLEKIFHIKTGFHGPILSNLARLRFQDAVDTANEKHMRPWNDLCQRHSIESTPLSPFMSAELLDHNHLFIDGSAIESTGFTYSFPVVQEEGLIQSINRAIEAGIFPNVLHK